MSIKMLTINSDPKNLMKVEHYLIKLKDELEICKDRYPDILISLTEAVNNAIFHGNKVDFKKKVNIKSVANPSSLSFTVSDEGVGFDRAKIPDPRCPENIECCGGRGVMIMAELCDKLSFINNGSSVKLVFHSIR